MNIEREMIIAILGIIALMSVSTVIVFLVGGDDQVYGQEIMMCFATKQLADDFLKQFPEHSNHNVVIGCPVFNMNHTMEDESGK